MKQSLLIAFAVAAMAATGCSMPQSKVTSENMQKADTALFNANGFTVIGYQGRGDDTGQAYWFNCYTLKKAFDDKGITYTGCTRARAYGDEEGAEAITDNVKANRGIYKLEALEIPKGPQQ